MQLQLGGRMADKGPADAQPESKEPGETATEPAGPLTLNTMLKKTFAAIIALVGAGAATAVFTARFARTGPELITITLAALAAMMLFGVGFVALYTYRKKKITTSVSALAVAAILVLAAGARVGYITWHARSSASSGSGSCFYEAKCPALEGTLAGRAHTENIWPGSLNPRGYVAGLNLPGSSVALTFTGVPAAGTYALTVRYANYQGNDGKKELRDMSILVGRNYAGPITLPLTNGWAGWELAHAKVALQAGGNTITLACRRVSHDSCHVNIDWIEVSPLSVGLPGNQISPFAWCEHEHKDQAGEFGPDAVGNRRCQDGYRITAHDMLAAATSVDRYNLGDA